jgi:hypothetical protein
MLTPQTNKIENLCIVAANEIRRSLRKTRQPKQWPDRDFDSII